MAKIGAHLQTLSEN